MHKQDGATGTTLCERPCLDGHPTICIVLFHARTDGGKVIDNYQIRVGNHVILKRLRLQVAQVRQTERHQVRSGNLEVVGIRKRVLLAVVIALNELACQPPASRRRGTAPATLPYTSSGRSPNGSD